LQLQGISTTSPRDFDRVFGDKTGTIFARSGIARRRWLFSIPVFLRVNRVSVDSSEKSG